MDDNKNLSNEMNEKELVETIARLDETLEQISKRLEEITTEKPKTKVISNVLNKKLVATMVATFMLVFSLAVCTYAYFVSTVSSEGNIIATGYASAVLHDTTDHSYPTDPDNSDEYLIFPGYSIKKSVRVKNNGSYPLYIRAKIDSTITLDERYATRADEIDMSLVGYSIDVANWTERDGYYYYNVPLKRGEFTTNMLNSVDFSVEMGNIYKDSTIKVKILLEVVQANGNGETVFDAVGWTSAEEGGRP